jgi:hypothetical protein
MVGGKGPNIWLALLIRSWSPAAAALPGNDNAAATNSTTIMTAQGKLRVSLFMIILRYDRFDLPV